MIELYAVPPGEDDAFRAAWSTEAPPGARLYRALRGDVRYRFASVVDGPSDGVVLIGDASVAVDRFVGARGFLGARVEGELMVVHWSSPLMYARTGVVLPGAAVYAPLV